MYYVYALFNKEHNKIYIGQTENIAERVLAHNNHSFDRSYTARYSGEWKLFYIEEFNTRSEALKREKQLKSYRGREFIKQIIPR